jgi:hypothetical protein
MEEQQLPLACPPRSECYMSKPHSSANNGSIMCQQSSDSKSFLPTRILKLVSFEEKAY